MTGTTHKEVSAMARAGRVLGAWFDSSAVAPEAGDAKRIEWLRVLPFIALHLACFGVLWVGWSWTAVGVALALYALRMLAITGFYHRYFSHKAFRTSRAMQFVFALLGASAAQRGPLWWASQHRHHHAHADDEQDAHSPHRHGFLWSHTGWFMARANFATRMAAVPDLAKYPELRFLDRFDALVPLLLALGLYGAGELLAYGAPALGTSGLQLAGVGLRDLDRAAVPRDLHRELARPHPRLAALRDPRPEPQQPVAGAAHLRRGLAQQPPPFPGLGAPGLLLVGDRSHLLLPQAARRTRPDLGPAPGSGRPARGTSRSEVCMKIAIIGTGISGNVAAYHLSREHDITVFEAGDHVGGHTHTHAIEQDGQSL